MPARIRKANVPAIEFETSPRGDFARVVDVVYTFVPPPGMEFDEVAVRNIREQWDPGFVPFHRKMVFRTTTGEDVVRHNWGVARYSEKGVQNEQLKRAQRPLHGYFSKLEVPTDIDGIYPFGVGMDKRGMPAPYVPFVRELVEGHCREQYGIAQERYRALQPIREAEKEARIEAALDEADQRFADMIPRSDWSTAVKPTPVKDQIHNRSQNVTQ